jgi:hypothetical protein
VHQLDAGGLLQHLADEVVERAIARGGDGDLARLLLGHGDHFADFAKPALGIPAVRARPHPGWPGAARLRCHRRSESRRKSPA